MVAYDATRKTESKTPVRFGKIESENGFRDFAARMLKAFPGAEVPKS